MFWGQKEAFIDFEWLSLYLQIQVICVCVCVCVYSYIQGERDKEYLGTFKIVWDTGMVYEGWLKLWLSVGTLVKDLDSAASPLGHDDLQPFVY